LSDVSDNCPNRKRLTLKGVPPARIDRDSAAQATYQGFGGKRAAGFTESTNSAVWFTTHTAEFLFARMAKTA
jgi:hypothetical protein